MDDSLADSVFDVESDGSDFGPAAVCNMLILLRDASAHPGIAKGQDKSSSKGQSSCFEISTKETCSFKAQTCAEETAGNSENEANPQEAPEAYYR